MKRTRPCCVSAVAVAATLLTSLASGQTVSIGFEGNSLGGLHGQAGPGGNWVWVQANDQIDIQVVNDRSSPIGGGGQSVKYAANSGSSRIGVSLGSTFSQGVVKIQWDFFTSTDAAQGAYRLIAFRPDPEPHAVTPPSAVAMGQLYMAGAGGGYTLGGWLSAPNADPSFNDNVLTRSAAAGACEGRWYRIAYYFDLDQASAPLIYSELFDINNGTATRVAERRSNDGTLTFNRTTATKEIRSIALRAPGSQNENFYLDNITVAAVPGFQPPANQIPLNDPGDPAPTPRPAQRADVTETAVNELDLGGPIGQMASAVTVGNTLWMLDDFFGLQSWDTVARPASATFENAAFEIAFRDNPAAIMVPTGDGSGLYVWSDTLGLGSLNGNPPWRDLAKYDIGTGTWSLVVDGDVFTGTGDSGIARAVVNGNELVYSAWMGATQYTGINATAHTTAPAITGVGNRWAGALTEGRTADELIMLAHTDADGNRLNGLTGQVYQGLYRSTWIPGCVNASAVLRRISGSAQVVPWTLACNDGGCVNRATLEYVPATNCIWLSRAAGTNDLGVYDLDTDTWGIVKVNMPDGSPLNMENVDLQLVGDRMYIYCEGYANVFSINALLDGTTPCAADFNGDGFLDFFDADAFIACFEGTECPPGKTADYNGDDFVDFFDVDQFIAEFEAGC